MKRYWGIIWLCIGMFVIVTGCASKPTCAARLSTAQCANAGTHQYARTYNFIEGCGKADSFVPGPSEITWTFSAAGDSVQFPLLLKDSPPAPIALTNLEPDTYRATGDEPGDSQLELSEAGFIWRYFQPETNETCYEVVFTLTD